MEFNGKEGRTVKDRMREEGRTDSEGQDEGGGKDGKEGMTG